MSLRHRVAALCGLVVGSSPLIASCGGSGTPAPPPDPYPKYAAAIARLDTAMATAVGFNIFMDSAPVVVRIRSAAADFDAVNPPADLVRLHEQLVAQAATASQATGQLVAHMQKATCRLSKTTYCPDWTENDMIAASRLQSEIPLYNKTYEEVHARATRMLAEHGVTLPPIPTSRRVRDEQRAAQRR